MGYSKIGTALDALLELWQAGDGNAAATGYKINGADLNTRYAPASVGTGYTGGTSYSQNGADIGPRFCAKGQRAGTSPPQGSFIAKSFGTQGSAMDANVTVSIKSDGTYSITTAGNGATTTPGTSGTWLPSGQAASDYQVQFTWAQSSQRPDGPATITNGASTYQACTSNHQLSVDAQVGQLTALDRGSVGNITINLKRISTGVVSSGIVSVDVESAGSG